MHTLCGLTPSPPPVFPTAGCWQVDPLDGTTNYVHGFPFPCVSIALAVAKEPVVGVVYNPILQECFAAAKGAGATLNGKTIRCSQETGGGEDTEMHPSRQLKQLLHSMINRQHATTPDLARQVQWWQLASTALPEMLCVPNSGGCCCCRRHAGILQAFTRQALKAGRPTSQQQAGDSMPHMPSSRNMPSYCWSLDGVLF